MKNIENCLSAYKLKTRQELAEEMQTSEREVRREISQLKQKRVVLYNSSIKGYRLAREIKSMSTVELEREIDLVNRCIRDIESRKKVFNKQLRKYIAYQKKAEQYLLEEQNYNHIPRID